MLDFIWHLRGSVALQSTDSDDFVLDRLENFLEKQEKFISERRNACLSFGDPLALNIRKTWLAMTIYDRGRFWIVREGKSAKLHYDLRSLHVLLFCLLIAVGFSSFELFAGRSNSALGIASTTFLWLYGVNMLFGLVRVRFAIREAIRTP